MTTPDQSPQYTPPPRGGGGGSWLDEISAWAAAAGEAAAAPAGGYSFEPDELISIAREWDDLAAGYERDIRYADQLCTVEGPGAEYASGDNAQLVRQSGQTLRSTLQERIDYCHAQAKKFRAAAGHYAEAEADAGAEIGKQGGSL
ncbi:PE domain-containing protein [Amycolatopsis albispora]|uniref:PE domain-containing protein n=1 Tax=Amycolatopsis albispora TaxID=1804986 RepID=A0A344LF81_9PSEU|nr:PE domain-containing protein [Amycolatopsis albispora]AXB46705.1 hypothetical protein A4R43_33220 [Amycolatopsis albispora]